MKNGMKKILFLLLWIPAIIACTEKNTPVDTTGDTTSVDTTTTTPADTTITTTDTIRISWSGTAATVEGVNSGVTVTETNGYVTVNSTVKDITYILSGSGSGQLTIYGTNRHQLVLSNLTLTCSDGPAINNQCKKSCFVVLEGSNTLADGSTYATSDEDRKAAFFSEGQMIFSGSGSLTVNGNYKHAILPQTIIPFTAYSLLFILTVLADYVNRTCTVEEVCAHWHIAVSTLYAWKKRYMEHYDAWAVSIDNPHLQTDNPLSGSDSSDPQRIRNAVNSTLNQIRFSLPSIVSSFFRRFGFSFLQPNRKTHFREIPGSRRARI